jgi:hypothetical protein
VLTVLRVHPSIRDVKRDQMEQSVAVVFIVVPLETTIGKSAMSVEAQEEKRTNVALPAKGQDGHMFPKACFDAFMKASKGAIIQTDV